MARNFPDALSLAGLSATLVGSGIGRFAYIALMPVLIQSGWFSKSDASYLGAAALLGYLLGAPMVRTLQRYLHSSTLLRATMLICSLSFLACAVPEAAMSWYYVWRMIAGFCSAILMVLAAPTVVAQSLHSARGRITGTVFSGVGAGIMVSGLLVPVLVLHSISMAWLGLGLLSLALTALAWPQWPSENPGPHPKANPVTHAPIPRDRRIAVGFLLAAYSLDAVGYLPHTLFWVDYIVRDLHLPLGVGGFFWAVYGLGATIGPQIASRLADRVGFKNSLIVYYLIKSAAVALPLLGSNMALLFASSCVVGMCTSGILTLVSTYTLDCVGKPHHTKVWSLMTFGFAAAQAVTGYLMAYFVATGWTYRHLFGISSVALLCAVGCLACIRVHK
jgi:MFS family permease